MKEGYHKHEIETDRKKIFGIRNFNLQTEVTIQKGIWIVEFRFYVSVACHWSEYETDLIDFELISSMGCKVQCCCKQGILSG